MASVTKKMMKDGKTQRGWMARLNIDNPAAGQAKTQAKMIPDSAGMSEKKAREEAVILERAANQSKLNTSNVTVREYAEDLLGQRRIRTTCSTRSTYITRLRSSILPVKCAGGKALGDKAMKEITSGDIEQIYVEARAKGRSANSMRGISNVVSIIFKRAVKERLISENPVAFVVEGAADPVKKEHARRNDAPEGVQKAFEEKLIGPLFEVLRTRDRKGPVIPAVYLCYYLGLRRGEALGLAWADVDFDTGRIEIWQQLRRTLGQSVDGDGSSYGTELSELKTEKSHRTITAPPQLISFLREWKLAQPAGAKMVCAWSETSAHPTNVSRAFVLLAEIVGSDKGLHSLRHLHATKLFSAKHQPRAIADRLGHAKLETLLETYVGKLADDDDAIAADIASWG